VELRTARLILRPYATTDFEESAAMWGNPDVVRFIGGLPATREASWSRTLRYIGHWTAFGYGMWAVRDHENRFCGDVGICDFQRDIDPPIEMPEAGWVLAPWAQGRGFASEALTAAIKWFEDTGGARELACMIDPPNTPSIRVAEKHGFVQARRTLYHGDEVIVFNRPSTPRRASRATS
jgi:RimJ/RimL family protein N-acetyltransferase